MPLRVSWFGARWATLSTTGIDCRRVDTSTLLDTSLVTELRQSLSNKPLVTMCSVSLRLFVVMTAFGGGCNSPAESVALSLFLPQAKATYLKRRVDFADVAAVDCGAVSSRLRIFRATLR